MAYAERVFALQAPQDDGRSLSAHLEAAAPHSEDARRQLEIDPLCDAAQPLWGWYQELAARRGSNGFGPNKVSYAEIEAWERRSGVTLHEHEVEWVFELDRIFLAAIQPPEKPKAQRGGKSK
jgi:hypothetical protein